MANRRFTELIWLFKFEPGEERRFIRTFMLTNGFKQVRVGSPLPKFIDQVALIGGFLCMMLTVSYLIMIHWTKPLHELKLALHYQRLRKQYLKSAGQDQVEAQDELFVRATNWKFKLRWCLQRNLHPLDCCFRCKRKSELHPNESNRVVDPENSAAASQEENVSFEQLAKYYQ